MIALSAYRVLTPCGDAQATLQALAEERARPGVLPGPLLPHLQQLLSNGPWAPQLIVVASTKGDGPLWMADCLGAAQGIGSPAWLAQQLGTAYACPAWAISVACASGPAAVAVAGMVIRSGRFNRVLVVGADRLLPMVSEGFASLGALSKDTMARPFDQQRSGLALGEATAALWFTSEEPGPLYLHGWGLSCDANHLTGPHRQGRGLAAACERALNGAAPTTIITHGTGTQYNDDAEIAAYAQVAPMAALTGWKGGLGHSLGSCGVVEIALAAAAHEHSRLPGIQGLRHGPPGPRLLSPGWHPYAGERVLSANAGFGGLNGAVCFGQVAQAPPPPTAVTPQQAWRVHLFPWGWQQDRGTSQHQQPWTFATDDTGPEALPRLSARQITGHLDPSWGRMDLSSRLLVAMALLAEESFPEGCASLLLSERLCAESDRHCELARQAGSCDRQRFAYTLPSTPLGELSIRLGLRGPALALPGLSDDDGRVLVQELLSDGAPAVLLARVEADQPPHLAWLEYWLPGSQTTPADQAGDFTPLPSGLSS